MDLPPPVFCVMMMCLFGARCCDELNTSCPEIPTMSLTETPPRTCFQINATFRYMCIKGYLRKAGTSGLTRCRVNDRVSQWTPVSLQCIRDPMRTTTQLPNTSVTPVLTSQQQTRNISASVATETDPDSTSSSLQGPRWSDGSQGFANATDTSIGMSSTSMTAEPSNNSTHHLHMHGLSSTTTTLIIIASLLIVSAVIGISFMCYRRRSNDNRTRHPAEEQIPMNQDPATQV
ncbi:interleukin-15 receptor subunit alpha isoform X2 [Antennarius striatus]|uniref:interleukin-15 receptor subunit alpha isoform X2 n=1 Tax=Antennarius striatus TaxID=241820 RepID=UPI0035B368B0